jgi:hypothetical protein
MAKRKTSSVIDEDLWRDWMICVIKKYHSSRKASVAIEDAMRAYMKQ